MGQRAESIGYEAWGIEIRREREDHFGFRKVKLSCCDLSVVPPRADPFVSCSKNKGHGDKAEKARKAGKGESGAGFTRRYTKNSGARIQNPGE